MTVEQVDTPCIGQAHSRQLGADLEAWCILWFVRNWCSLPTSLSSLPSHIARSTAADVQAALNLFG